MMRRVILLMVLLLLIAAPALALEMRVVNVEEWVSLRSAPEGTSERLIKVPLGAVVENCQYITNEWMQCTYEGKTGYVKTQYLTAYEKAPAVSLGAMQVTNVEEWASLRKSPNAKSDRLVKVPLGAVVNNCQTDENGFVYCEYEGRTGYIHQDYLTRYQAPSYDLQVDQLTVARQQMLDMGTPLGALSLASDIDLDGSLKGNDMALGQILARAEDKWQPVLSALYGGTLAEVPQGQQLYLLIPAKASSTLTVHRWDPAAGLGEMLAQGIPGEPLLVRCTATGFNPDCQVTLTDEMGSSFVWYPFLDQATGGVRTQGVGGSVADLAVEYQPREPETITSLVQVRPADAALSQYSAWDVFFADRNPSLSYVLFSCEHPVQEFKLLRLSYENEAFTTEEIYTAEWMASDRPLAVGMTIDSTIPNYGFSYVDGNRTYHFYVTLSGYDGSLITAPF